MSNNNLIFEPTGGYLEKESYRIIDCNIGEFKVKVKVNSKNEFIGIENISVDKIFYNYRDVQAGYDVSRYYED